MAKGEKKNKDRERNRDITAEISSRSELINKNWAKVGSSKDIDDLLSKAKAPVNYGGLQSRLDSIPPEYHAKGKKELNSLIKKLQSASQLYKLIDTLEGKLNGISSTDVKGRVSYLITISCEKWWSDVKNIILFPFS